MRGGGFQRFPEQELRRRKVARVDQNTTRFEIDIGVFKDAVSYWSIVYDAGLVQHAAIGSKLLSTHRNEDTRACVGLTWFEIEKWLTPYADSLGIDVYSRKKGGAIKTDIRSGQPMFRAVSRIIKDFPVGTWVSAHENELLDVAWIRNQVAHKGYQPSITESAATIEMFMKVFNHRTGLLLRADTNRTPTIGVSS